VRRLSVSVSHGPEHRACYRPRARARSSYEIATASGFRGYASRSGPLVRLPSRRPTATWPARHQSPSATTGRQSTAGSGRGSPSASPSAATTTAQPVARKYEVDQSMLDRICSRLASRDQTSEKRTAGHDYSEVLRARPRPRRTGGPDGDANLPRPHGVGAEPNGGLPRAREGPGGQTSCRPEANQDFASAGPLAVACWHWAGVFSFIVDDNDWQNGCQSLKLLRWMFPSPN
jgi:hypothetical protein